MVATGGYSTVDHLLQDLETATSGVIESLRDSPAHDLVAQTTSRATRIQTSRIIRIKSKLDDLIRVELVRNTRTIRPPNNVKDENTKEIKASTSLDDSEDNVLTLYGQADPRSAKQLFSSMRKPNTSQHPLTQTLLPNGITTTKIIPQHSLNEGEKPPIMKDLFSPPSGIPALPIPKVSKHTSTRSSSVNWYNPQEADSKGKVGRRENFTLQPLSTGHWLTYNVAPSPTQLASPESKRKQRDRALSFGEPQPALSTETVVAHNQEKEDALFRSVYSSFAPDRDDSGALVAEQTKNRLWWGKYGRSKFEKVLGMRDTLAGKADPDIMNGTTVEEELNEEELRESIESWQPEEMIQGEKILGKGTDTPNADRDVDDILLDISDLLETLESHQRVRNLTIPGNTRQNPQIGAVTSGPPSPSAAEFEVYETLKAQLTLIISTLPPFILAKLDGERLGALKLSTKIHVEGMNQRGTMEDGEAAIAARSARLTAPTPGSTSNAYATAPSRSTSYVQPAATPVQQFSRASYGASNASRPVNPSYPPSAQYPNRPATSTYSPAAPRPGYGPQGGYTPQVVGSAASRYNYGQAFGQTQAQSASQYSSYQNGYRPYASQNGGSYNYNAQYSTPQARPGPQASQYRSGQSDYQQRAVPPQGYGYGSTQGAGSASPQVKERTSYSGPTQSQSSNQQRPQLSHQNSSYQSQSQTPASPQVNGTAAHTSTGSPAQQGHLSAEEQAVLMERQKAQLAERAPSQGRQGSGTPQPASGGQNGTPAPQQNGIAA